MSCYPEKCKTKEGPIEGDMRNIGTACFCHHGNFGLPGLPNLYENERKVCSFQSFYSQPVFVNSIEEVWMIALEMIYRQTNFQGVYL